MKKDLLILENIPVDEDEDRRFATLKKKEERNKRN